MAENEKTAPISSVGTDEGKSIPSNSIFAKPQGFTKIVRYARSKSLICVCARTSDV